MKKMLALLLALTMAFALVACGGNNSSNTGNNSGNNTANDQTGDDSTAAGGEVYYLNFKPEQDAQWQELAQLYTEETGVPVTVVTAASGEYETTLMSEMGKSNPPTLFQVNGPVGLANWKDYCYDLSGSAVYGELTSDEYALKDGDAVLGIAYVIESYGIIVNKTLLAEAGYSVEDIQSFEDLKKVAEDITARKDELGFAAFTSAGMDGSSDWRFKTHLANLPIYFEYQDKGISSSRAPTWITTRPSGICTSITPPAPPRSWPARPVTTARTSSLTARPSSSRMVPGSMPTWWARASTPTRIWP